MTAAAAVRPEELPALQKLRQAVEGALEGKQDAVELAPDRELERAQGRGQLRVVDLLELHHLGSAELTNDDCAHK